MDHDVLTEVPEALKRLVRYVVRGFYSIEHALLIDMLVHYPCIKEDDLLELLQFDRKQLRSVVHTLKVDKLIKSKMQVETDDDNKVTRHNFFYINYSTFVNVVKYKLDHMRRRIESEERNATNRSSFSCDNCLKTYTDLEADRLFDFPTQLFLCQYCRTELQVVTAEVLPGADSRTMMIKFNEQIEPVYALLREVEDIKLAPSILEPAPLHLRFDRKAGGGVHGTTRGVNTADGVVWSGEATRNMDYFGTSEPTISMNLTSMVDTAPETKAQPIWMTQSTIVAPDKNNKSKDIKDAGDTSNQTLPENDEIMRTLLTHENKTGKSNTPAKPSKIHIAGESDASSSSDSETETKPSAMKTQIPGTQVAEMDSDGDDEMEQMVMVGGVKVAYNDIKEEMISKMSPEEKSEYIRIGQELFNNMFE